MFTGTRLKEDSSRLSLQTFRNPKPETLHLLRSCTLSEIFSDFSRVAFRRETSSDPACQVVAVQGKGSLDRQYIADRLMHGQAGR